jgi:hypothetical protein
MRIQNVQFKKNNSGRDYTVQHNLNFQRAMEKWEKNADL